MRSYNDLIALVRQWANRDEEVLTNTIIGDCLTYAADKAYRTLRVPPLERVITFDSATLSANTTPANNGAQTITAITIPEDLIEFIQIRAVKENGSTGRVFNEKADVRTFYDPYAEKYSNIGYWTRKSNQILLAPGFEQGTENSVELYYYRRLYELDARAQVTAANANVNETYINEVVGSAPLNNRTGESVPTKQLKKVVYTNATTSAVLSTVYYETTVADGDIPAAPIGQIRTITTNTYYGSEIYNWLKDENERILLNGALAELFIFLKEPETAKMYLDIFRSEIAELNNEEAQRRASGGNIQFNFNSNGLI